MTDTAIGATESAPDILHAPPALPMSMPHSARDARPRATPPAGESRIGARNWPTAQGPLSTGAPESALARETHRRIGSQDATQG